MAYAALAFACHPARGYDEGVSHSASEIIDLRGYCVRLLKQWLRAVPAFLITLGIAVPWVLLQDETWEAKSMVGIIAPQPTTEAEAIYYSGALTDLVSSDEQMASLHPKILEKISAGHPDIKPEQISERVEIDLVGDVSLLFTATAPTAKESVRLANDYATAFLDVVSERSGTSATYQQVAAATEPTATKISSKLAMLLVAGVAAIGMWVIAAALLDARAMRKAKSA